MGRPEDAERPAPQRIRIRREVWRWDVKVWRSVGEMLEVGGDVEVDVVVLGLCGLLGVAEGAMVVRSLCLVVIEWVG